MQLLNWVTLNCSACLLLVQAENQVALNALPVRAAARAAGCESRDEAKARHLPLIDTGAQC
jgi:hypothetical protein